MWVSMNISFATSTFCLISLFFFLWVIPTVLCKGKAEHAVTPPRGWNSYDSFGWTISEDEFLQNAELLSKRLRSHGYEYVVVDYLWYRRKVPGAYPDSSGFDVIDEWGRMIPDPDRWPSSKGGKGFIEVANKVHSMGLKFGIHVMRGISFQAVNSNTPILDTTQGVAYTEGGRKWSANDIGIKERACAWMSHGFMSVNTKTGAGRAFLRSLYEQYAQWGVDFVKHDCVFGDDLDVEEISFVSEVLKKLDRPIMYSLSPGTSVTPAMAKQVSGLVNMYRITGDDWDTWGDVASHFDVTRDLATSGMIGSTGLMGRSWPDLDMLPLGWLTDPGSNEGPHRQSKLNIDEQKTQITLWAMAKSPLMFGGDMRKLDDVTYNLITNPTILEINAFSSNNKEFPLVMGPNAHKCSQNINTTQSRSSSLALVSCMETKAKGWGIKSLNPDFDQICWGENSESYESPFCLYTKKTLLTSDVGSIQKPLYHRKSHLLTSTSIPLCIHASSKQRLTSKDIRTGSLSPCEWHDNQMWELGSNGTLMSSYSGLCASVQKEGNVIRGGVRSWIATGRRGEIYLAFFNLNQAKTKASARWSDVAKAVPDVKPRASCGCKEVWSDKPCQRRGGLLSMDVEAHGVALLLLACRS